ncbi:MAG: hypothetical protein GY903_27980 [Fuerstiella sp.]|nr:hypothetical protein [Fuerstiella sp.]MCP4858335.1 hypothetical protein [Fuerstiella sp.]
MSQRLNIAEPALPEHELIRDAMPMPKLSAGFKSRVVAECGVSIATARRAFRLKVAGSFAAVCCLGGLFCLPIPPNSPVDRQMTDQPAGPQPANQEPVSPGLSFGIPPGGSRMTVDAPKPPATEEPDSRQMNKIIEQLNDRGQMFNANMLPKF